MKLLYKYLLKNFLFYFFIFLAIFSILVISSQMLNLPSALYHINIFRFLQSLLLINLSFFKIQLIFAYSLAFLFIGYSLRERREIYAIYSAGISKAVFLRLFVIIGLIFSMFAFLISFFIVPKANRERMKFITVTVKKYFLESINPKNFTTLPGNYVIYISDKKDNKLFNTMIYNKKNGFLITAKKAVFEKSSLILYNGILQLPTKEGFSALSYEKYIFDLKISYEKKYTLEDFKIRDLIYLVKKGNQKDRLKAISVISERIGYIIPFIFFSSVFFFLGLGILKDRDFVLALGIGVLIVYLSLNYYLVKLIEKGSITPIIYLGLITGFCFVLLYSLYKKV